MCVLYVYMTGQVIRRDRGGAGDAGRRASSSRPFGVPGGRDRVVEQSDFGPDALDARDRGAADGVARRVGDAAAWWRCSAVAAVVCVSSAVAGELLQDFKVGYILGGTPRTIQISELIAVVVASCVMYFPLLVLHRATSRRAASASATGAARAAGRA